MRSYQRLFVALSLIAVCGCATTPAPLSYLSLEKPQGPIHTTNGQKLVKEFPRGGWYFGNYNFRPAADVHSYIEHAEKQANATVLRNADVELKVPAAFDILFFGYNHADDSIALKPEAPAQLQPQAKAQ